jgi:predicted AAA+ superfamily ATPase
LIAGTEQPLYYWTSNGKAELDYLVGNEGRVYPLEVKSGTSGHKKSLQVYDEAYHPKALLRTSPQNLKKDGHFLNVPLYLISRWRNFV